jgi:hypothetical protein
MIEEMGRVLSAVAIAMLALACATPKPPTANGADCGTSDAEAGHALSVSLSLARDEQRRPLCPGQALTPSDALWISVELEAEAHVRLIYIAPDGQAGELLHQEDRDLIDHAVFRAPKGLLSRADGEAQLFLIASKQPLTESDATMALLLDLIRDTGTLVARDGSLQPAAQGSVAPPDLMKLDISENLFADFDDKGMAMLAISLRASR